MDADVAIWVVRLVDVLRQKVQSSSRSQRFSVAGSGHHLQPALSRDVKSSKQQLCCHDHSIDAFLTFMTSADESWMATLLPRLPICWSENARWWPFAPAAAQQRIRWAASAHLTLISQHL